MYFVQLSTNQGEKVRFSEKFYYARLTFSLCFTSKTSVNSTNQKENLRFVGVFCTVKYEPVYLRLNAPQTPNPLLLTFVQFSTNCNLRFFREIFV